MDLLEVAVNKFLSYIDIDGTELTPMQQYQKLIQLTDHQKSESVTNYPYICNTIIGSPDPDKVTTVQDVIDEIESLLETLQELQCSTAGRAYMTLHNIVTEEPMGIISYILNPKVFNGHEAWQDFSNVYKDDPHSEHYTVAEFVKTAQENVPTICITQIYLDFSQPH